MKENYLDKNISNRPLRLVLKTRNFQVYHYYEIVPLNAKSKRSQYGKVQRSEEDKKSQKSEQRLQRGKINPLVRRNSDCEVFIII